MKGAFFLITFAAWINTAAAQNIGIATDLPSRGKLDVPGVAGAGATGGAFGTDGAGISFQRNWPTIGFNQYRDEITPGSQGRYMANGYAAIEYLDPGSGMYVFNLFPQGTKGAYTPAGIYPVVIAANGNTGIQTNVTNASLTLARGNGQHGTLAILGLNDTTMFNAGTLEYTYVSSGANNGILRINEQTNGTALFGLTAAKIAINNRGVAPVKTLEIRHPPYTGALGLEDKLGNKWSLRAVLSNIGGSSLSLGFYYNDQPKGYMIGINGAYYTVSDERLKRDIADMPPVLDQINRLNPVRYGLLLDPTGKKENIGFIAQEVETIFPAAVRHVPAKSTQENGAETISMLNYSIFSVAAIKALQEQQLQIQQLTQKRDALLKRLTALEEALTRPW